MNKKLHNGLGKGVFYLSLAVCLDSAPAWAAPLKEWQYNPTTNQLEVTLKDGVQPRYFLMARPARIVLDLPNTEVGSVQRQQTYEGAVRQVRVSEIKPGLTRIVLELSPDATLLRGQAQLQRVGDAEQSSDRWVLRPLLAQALANQPATSTPPPIAINQPPPVVYPPGISPTQPEVIAPREVDRLIPKLPDKPIDIVVPPPATTPLSSDLPPTTVPLVVEPASPKIVSVPTPPSPENFPPGIAPSLEPSVTTPASPAVSPQVPTSNSEPSSRIAQKPTSSLQLPEINPSLAIPDSLPPVTAPNSATVAPTVSVPPLNRAPSVPNSASDLPPAGISNPATALTVPPLQPTAPQTAIAPQSTRSRQLSPIEFGQPLPTLPGMERSSQPPGLISYNPTSRLSAGTVLSLRYPGSQALPLQANQPRQEVLVLQNSLRDRAGNLIAPEGTEVLGKFETIGGGSRFIAQAILLKGQNVTIAAQSELLSGGARKVSDNRLIRNSGIGALAGAILGGLSGGNVIGGAAAGVAVTYATTPKSATIQPGQILEVRLTEDFR